MIPHLSKICIFLLVFVTMCSRAQISPPWIHIKLDTSVENFITHQKSGSLVVAQGPKLFKYNEKFELLESNQYTNVSDNRILHLLAANIDQELLLSCWKPQDLQCTLNKFDSLKENTNLFTLAKGEDFKLIQDGKLRVMNIPNNGLDIIIATGRSAPVEPVIAQPAMGRFKISKSNAWFSEQLSVLNYKNGQNLNYDYIYVFRHNQYTYFILNDQLDDRHRARLARVCDNDAALTSYAEITLACNKEDNVVAKYAFFDSTNEVPTLHIAFEHRANSRQAKSGTLLCQYDMSLAEEYIHNAIRECNNGAPDLSLLTKFGSEQICQKNPADDSTFCLSRLNPYINGTIDKYKLGIGSHIYIEGMISVNFLHIMKQGGDEREVYFVGTESGQLTKLTVDEKLLYSIDLPKSTIRTYRENKYSSASISDENPKSIRYTVDSRGILAVSSEGQLDRLDPNACYYYTSCDSCLNSKDPLDCVWCGHTCSLKQDCEKSKRSTKSCPPYITDFRPKNGSLFGSTLLLIHGNHFGSSKGARHVKLGAQTCQVDDEKSNNTMIYCLTPPVNTSRSVSLLVEVSEVSEASSGLDLKGNTTAKDLYRYITMEEAVEAGFPILLIVIVFIILVLTIVTYFYRGARLSHLKEKIWPAIDSRASETPHLGVSYRGPQPGTNLAGSSINELVKINGSMMSSDNYFVSVDQSPMEQPLMKNILDNDLLSLLRQEKILIDRKLLTLGHVLGSGQFGRVYKGFLLVEETGDHVAVAVKTIHNKSMYDDALDNGEFVEEGLMMKDFEHENVLTLIGVTIDASGLPMVVTPFMLYGDLRSYISDEASSPTVRDLIQFGTQIAKGMAYLASLKFVHRDLAARNCMLDENLTVKVADFGLSRDIYERDYYSSENKKTKLPVKWMAIESLERCIYSSKTDVWSYGVLLWELMTRGVVPYPDVDNFDLFSYLKEGRRMMRPRYCPEILYEIMLSCWQENPNDRPTFDHLVEKVSAVISNLQVAKDGQQKVSRDETYCDNFKRPM